MSGSQRGFQIHATVWFAVNAFLFLIWLVTTAPGFPWFIFPAGGWGIGLVAHAASALTKPFDDDELESGPDYREIGR